MKILWALQHHGRAVENRTQDSTKDVIRYLQWHWSTRNNGISTIEITIAAIMWQYKFVCRYGSHDFDEQTTLGNPGKHEDIRSLVKVFIYNLVF